MLQHCMDMCHSPNGHRAVLVAIQRNSGGRLAVISEVLPVGLLALSSSWPSCEVVSALIMHAGVDNV